MENNNLDIEYEGRAISTSDFLKLIIKDSIKTFNELTAWKENDYLEFKKLLKELKDANGTNNIKSTEKGDKLEILVRFIIRKTYFFKVYGNVTTGTNEIDQVVTLSEEGKQALKQFKISRELIPIYSDLFLCECKNYKNSLGVTWIGKFYGLLNSCDCNFGIVFSAKGLTGKEDEWRNSFGLIRVFNMIEKYRHNRKFNIIEFNIIDYEKIASGINFFNLVEAKINAMTIATAYEQLLCDNKHEAEGKIKRLIQEI